MVVFIIPQGIDWIMARWTSVCMCRICWPARYISAALLFNSFNSFYWFLAFTLLRTITKLRKQRWTLSKRVLLLVIRRPRRCFWMMLLRRATFGPQKCRRSSRLIHKQTLQQSGIIDFVFDFCVTKLSFLSYISICICRMRQKMLI